MSSALSIEELAAQFLTVAELKVQHPELPAMMLGRYVRQGDIAILAGAPKAGKTTLLVEAVKAVVSEHGTFLGEEVQHGDVVIVSEERAAQVVEKLDGFEGVHVLTRDNAIPKPSWPALVAAALKRCEDTGAVLLIIDTLRWWSDLSGDQSKSDGFVMTALRELAAASALDVTVVLVHHLRKGGGEGGEGVANSNALVGAVDVLLEYETGSAPTERILKTLSRDPDAPPVTILNRDDTGRLQLVGVANDVGEAKSLGWRDRLLDALPTGEPGVPRDELADTLEADHRKWGSALNHLVADGTVARFGKGKKGDPYTFAICQITVQKMLPQNAAPAAGQKPLEEVVSDSPLPFREEGGIRNANNAVQNSTGQNGAERISGDEFADRLLADPDAGIVELER